MMKNKNTYEITFQADEFNKRFPTIHTDEKGIKGIKKYLDNSPNVGGSHTDGANTYIDVYSSATQEQYLGYVIITKIPPKDMSFEFKDEFHKFVSEVTRAIS